MLRVMRENTGSWIIKFLLGVIVLVFIFLGMGSIGSKNRNTVASVNGEPITMSEYKQSYQNVLSQMRSRFGDNLNDELLEMLQVKKQALDRLIEERLIFEEAEKLKIEISDKDVRDSLLRVSAFRKNGVFDIDTYKRVLARNRLTPETFEQMQKSSLKTSQVRDLILGSIAVSDMEAQAWYKLQNTSISIDYTVFDPDSYKDIDPGESEIKAFFEDNRDNYKSPAMVKAVYLKFSPEDYNDKAVIPPGKIKAYYEDNKDEFKTPEKVEARHILIKTSENADQETSDAAEAKALEIYEKAGENEDFAALAEKFSEGPSRENGGYLGSFAREDMVKPFADKAFSMEPGEISKPVRTRFGFHIIKVEARHEASEKSFDEAKPGILNKLKREEVKNLAYYDAGEVFDAVIDGDDLEQAGLIAGKEVMETEFFTEKGPEDFGANGAQFARYAFALPENEISDVKEIGRGYYILKTIDRKEPELLSLEEARERVVKDLKSDLQLKAAEKDAESFLASLEKSTGLKEAAEKAELEVKTTDFFKRKGAIPGLGNKPEIVKQAFKLTQENRMADKVIKSSNRFYIICLNEKKVPDQDEINENLDKTREEFAVSKQNKVYAEWIQALRDKSTIEISQGIID
ncbi:MAG: SurA N-terminal domain-containing protein [Thermodesulfobacteriota bacterium]|nr:SurA N-terminal domain-containing protein [Thermodesulfobacteriota bacterium]